MPWHLGELGGDEGGDKSAKACTNEVDGQRPHKNRTSLTETRMKDTEVVGLVSH